MAAQDIKTLRERTGAGFLDCKKAWDATGDIEQAIIWLKENGIAKAAKKSGRIAADGVINIVTDNNVALICEVNSETDFVARNEKFLQLVSDISTSIVKSEVKTNEEVMSLKVNDMSIEQALVQMTSIIGEKISFRRFVKITKQDEESFGIYLHHNKKVGTITLVQGGTQEVAKNVSMHATALNPQYMALEDIDQEEINAKLKALEKEAIDQGKPAAIASKIAQGRLNKELAEICLPKQEYVKGDGISVEQYLNDNKASLVKVIRFAVGEGIEKQETDFASEVNSQIKASQNK